MADRPNPIRAKIIKANEPGKFVSCHFNPQDFSITWKVKWNSETNIGNDASKLEYGGGEAQDLTMPLLFDTTDTQTDVRKAYGVLLELAQVDPKTKNPKTGKSEPPRCIFQWGQYTSFTAVITQISQKFTFFTLDGMPLRAEVAVTFKQLEQTLKPQNPTSRSEARKIWRIQPGDRLDWIAFQEYGDASKWRHIAEVNGITDPINLQPGRIIKLTPLL